MVYVYYFASFIVLLREVLRPGVLWFLRNLNDPDFSPIQVSEFFKLTTKNPREDEQATTADPYQNLYLENLKVQQFLSFAGNDSLVHLTSHTTPYRFCDNLRYSRFVDALVANSNSENTLANVLAVHLVG